MRRSMFAVLALTICFGAVFADHRKSSNAPDTAPMPASATAVAQASVIAPPLGTILPCPQATPIPDLAIAPPVGTILPCPQAIPPLPAPPRALEMPYQAEVASHRLPSDERSVLKVYHVGDLVVPMPCAGDCPPAAGRPKTLEAELIGRIRSLVAPKSWNGSGGKGTIDYFPLGMALVVNHDAGVQAAVEKFLDTERRMRDQQVMTEVRLLTVSDEWFENSGVRQALLTDGEKPAGQAPVKIVTTQILKRLLLSAKESPETKMITSPRIMCLNGQPGRVKVANQEHFVTAVNVQNVQGQLVFTPKNELQDMGVTFNLVPNVSADGKYVQLGIDCSCRELAVRPVATASITTNIFPVNEEGVKQDPVPFTQIIQQPKFVERGAKSAVTLPDGGTVLLYGGKAALEETIKEASPMLAKVPHLEQLFQQERKVTQTNHLLVIVTSKVVRHDTPMEADAVMPVKYESRLEKLLGDYSNACRQGKTDEARRLAIECLSIDPTCFGK